MAKFVKVQQGILRLGPGEYQRLCADYIVKKKGYESVHDIGSKEGTNKTTRGIPDSYSVNDDGTYSLIMYGTVTKKSIQKLESDIEDACSEAKTGISHEKIKEIICFHTNTNITPGEHNRLTTLYKDVKIELIDIDSMAHDICEKYQSLASDYLQISYDTNQISDIDKFIKRYDRFSVNSPLSIEYIERKEKEEIINCINNTETLLLLTGKPGTGKTKIAIEICKYLEKNEDLCCLCIRLNGEDIYEEIRTILENEKKYLIFIDDINQLRQLNSFMDCIITNQNKNIKIIATIRDYLLKETLDKLNNWGVEPNIYTLNKMEENDLIKILENSYNIKNKKWQQQILKISNGNPRIAIMASQSIIDGKIENLSSVLGVFQSYYDNVISQNKLTNPQIKMLFYISFFSPFSIKNKEIKSTLENMGIYDLEEFKKLSDLELIEFYNDEAIKISDQNFANYIIYKYLIELKEIKVSDLLIKIYPKFIKKFISIINMINGLFYNYEVLEYIKSEINDVWEKDDYKNDDLFLKSFHNVNVPKTITIIKNKIDLEKQIRIPQEIQYEENACKKNEMFEMLEILSDIKNTKYSKFAFELLISYLMKRPDLYNDIFENIKDFWLMKDESLDLELEKSIISIIIEKYDERNEYNSIIKYILIKSLEYCLNTEVHINKQGINFRQMIYLTIKLTPCESVFQFRKFLFETFVKICNDDSRYINVLRNSYIWPREEKQIEIIKIDFQILENELFCKWENPDIEQCEVLEFVEKMCQRRNILPTKSIHKYKQNKEYNILRIFEIYRYGKENTELNELLAKSSIEDYKHFFKILKKVENDKVKVEEYKIQNSVELLFEYIIKEKYEIFYEVFEQYLNYGCPFKSNPRYLFSLTNKNDVIELLIKSDNKSKYFFLSFLLDSFVDKRYLNNVENFLKEQQNNEEKYTLSLITIINYSKYNSSLIENYTKEILELDEINLLEIYVDSALFNVEKHQEIYNKFDNKEILEKLYFKVFDSYVDCEGNMGFLLGKNNYKFISQLIKGKGENYKEKIREIAKKLWEDENSDKLILNIYNEISNLSFNNSYSQHLFAYSDDTTKEKQNKWIKKYIDDNKSKKKKIKNIFYVVCERDSQSKEELILHLLEVSTDIEIFRDINLFPCIESWSGSRIPTIEKKIKFLENLKIKIINKQDIKYICHIECINSWIDDLKKYIIKTKTEEYLEDFYN